MKLIKCDYCGKIVEMDETLGSGKMYRVELPVETTAARDPRPFRMDDADVCEDCLKKVFDTLQHIKGIAVKNERIDPEDVAGAIKTVLMEQCQAHEGGDKP